MRLPLWLLLSASSLGCSPQLVDAITENGKAGTGATGQGGTASNGAGGTGSGAGGTGQSGGTPQGGTGSAGAPDTEGGQGGQEGETETPATLRGDALLHRYSFDGVGTRVSDSKGAAHGKLIGTELTGEGTVALDGGDSGQYVELPENLISGLGDATFEAWLTWAGGNAWQRIFDFGDSFETSNGAIHGRTYLFLTPKSSAETMRVAFSLAGSGEAEVRIDASVPLPEDELTHVALVFDDQNDRMALYLNGELEGDVAIFDKLSSINDVNNWLGRSQYAADAELGGVIHEFRIYDAALDAAKILVSFEAGPQAVFPSP
jgi:hypothetical protein